jgi:hypothetical protein
MECHICFTSKPDKDVVFLDCSHSLCKCCFNRLVNPTCPFCRAKFKKRFMNTINNKNVINTMSEDRYTKLFIKKRRKKGNPVYLDIENYSEKITIYLEN